MNFTNNSMLVLILTLLIFSLTSCDNEVAVSKEKWETLSLNMTLQQVEEVMGSPGKEKTFEGQNTDATYYQWKDPDSSDFIFVGILDNKVASMSSSYPPQ